MIEKITQSTKDSILQKSAYNLPDRPSDLGMNPVEIKKAFYKPILDASNSVITELDRIIDESNKILDDLTVGLNTIRENISSVLENSSNALEENRVLVDTVTNLKATVEAEVESIKATNSKLISDIENVVNITNGLSYDVDRKEFKITLYARGWSYLPEIKPFNYIYPFRIMGDNFGVIELINDNAILFGKYGFSLHMNDVSNIIALEKPNQDVTLTLSIQCDECYIDTEAYIY